LGEWIVVDPRGRVVSKHGADEAGARNHALYVNATSVEEERQQWATR
jgi:hypothetical protein